MHSLPPLYRAVYLYAVRAHHLASGPSFFSDHAQFATFYEAYETGYDQIVERMLGRGEKMNIAADTARSSVLFGDACKAGETPQVFFEQLDKMEKELCKALRNSMREEGVTEGTKNLLQGLCDQSEGRQYLIGRRKMA